MNTKVAKIQITNSDGEILAEVRLTEVEGLPDGITCILIAKGGMSVLKEAEEILRKQNAQRFGV